MNKKGQAAMEFLMTYGWAILVVIAAIAVLAASGLLDLSRYMPERCDFPIDFSCVGKASVRASGVFVSLRNGLDSAVTVNDVAFAQYCNGTKYVAEGAAGTLAALNTTTGLSVAKGEVVKIQINCTLTQGDIFEDDLSVDYTRTDNGAPYTATGTIKAKIA